MSFAAPRQAATRRTNAHGSVPAMRALGDGRLWSCARLAVGCSAANLVGPVAAHLARSTSTRSRCEADSSASPTRPSKPPVVALGSDWRAVERSFAAKLQLWVLAP